MVAEAWRTFVAIPLPAGVATTLEARLAPHRAAHAQARWSDLADAHLTLVFLGATPATVVPAVVDAVTRAAAGHVPFRVALHGAGSFGGRGRPLVAWLGIGAGAAELTALAADIRARLMTLPGLAYLAGAGEMRPHLTVARRAPASLAPLLRSAFADEGPAWTIDGLVVMRSHLGRDGARHEPLANVPLAAFPPSP
ncbi:MAG: 2'-5' RNA ligase, 2'-5' RNA ligase [Chloroflexi bacterium CSP1-4]|nr:MAG: 2'-5' RNA ligase, 2'-5' RNA ligase [Chloroflexi bacterium CSP1-4]